jgi:hypothetical protein
MVLLYRTNICVAACVYNTHSPCSFQPLTWENAFTHKPIPRMLHSQHVAVLCIVACLLGNATVISGFRIKYLDLLDRSFG